MTRRTSSPPKAFIVEPECIYAEAAAMLRVSEEWLRRNTPGRPTHYKKAKVTLSAEHIAEIRRMHEHRPSDALASPSQSGGGARTA